MKLNPRQLIQLRIAVDNFKTILDHGNKTSWNVEDDLLAVAELMQNSLRSAGMPHSPITPDTAMMSPNPASGGRPDLVVPQLDRLFARIEEMSSRAHMPTAVPMTEQQLSDAMLPHIYAMLEVQNSDLSTEPIT